ncbi:uncharacterized protein VTP21DRAFT_2799 [Calcarisporiella thermophila]|uniref:uncharacterized protein n=1 Tax=Calcarisporiella thermophila TaxID=911321 RepID=UPI003743FBAF
MDRRLLSRPFDIARFLRTPPPNPTSSPSQTSIAQTGHTSPVSEMPASETMRPAQNNYMVHFEDVVEPIDQVLRELRDAANDDTNYLSSSYSGDTQVPVPPPHASGTSRDSVTSLNSSFVPTPPLHTSLPSYSTSSLASPPPIDQLSSPPPPLHHHYHHLPKGMNDWGENHHTTLDMNDGHYGPFGDDHNSLLSESIDSHLRERLEAGPMPSRYVPPPPHAHTLFPAPPPPHAIIPRELSTPPINYAGGLHRRPCRRKTRRVQLVRGNLVLDCPVPTKLLQAVGKRDHDEFTHMRYTAATCDPNDFCRSNYTLRQRLYERETELFIVITMYNEDEVLFCRTMHGVMKNIAHLCTRKRSRTWGPEGWKKVVVCIVADGRKKCHPRVLSVLAAMGVYQDGIAKNIVNGKEVTAHIYEYTSQIAVDPSLRFKGSDKGIVPVQMIFCLKEKNQKKINSHRWFFNAFGPIIQPNVCVLLDVGTRPGNTSIYHLWKAFDISPNVGGACGEVCTMTGPGSINLLNPLVAAQNFEYKMSNILDKPLESIFGYICVLPGAFSAYRYTALQNDSKTGKGPLDSYFKGEYQHGCDADIFTANMYLAEDRILCYELVAKPNSSWLLRYVKTAFGETDVPDAVPEFISQRRRWLNGSFFVAVYAITHLTNIWRTNHNIGRQLLLHLEFIYNLVSLIFSWFAVANFYLTFYYVGISLSDPLTDPIGNNWGQRIFETLRYLYIFLIIVQFVAAMGNRPQGSKWLFTLSMLFFAIIMVYMMFAACYLTIMTTKRSIEDGIFSSLQEAFKHRDFRDVVISMSSTYGLYFASGLLYFDPWHMLTSFLQYMLLLPSYINILNIYAFCNTHDVSWGTKGDNQVSMDLGVAAPASEAKTDEVEVELPTEQKDINAMYEDALSDLKRKHTDAHQGRDARTKREDYYRSFRTHLVLTWIACNAILIAVITSHQFDPLFGKESTLRGGALGNYYMTGLLWGIAGMTAFRFLGSCVYLIAWNLFWR